MRARLGFSVAVHVDPEILVVYEVLAVGDARFRQRCAEKMRELFSRGTTVVMVQHSMEAIMEMCHRCMWLDKGSVKKIGEPYEVIKSYLENQGLPMIDSKSSFANDMSAPNMSGDGGAASIGSDGLT
jgi:ABC-type polysaccharide/polyol phosphate transport system ATPase subunit